jgi:hypothetical protein
MVSRTCETTTCLIKRRHRPALWLIDGVPHCNPCFETWMESNYIEEHRVHRLSDREDDFNGWPSDHPEPRGPQKLTLAKRSAHA